MVWGAIIGAAASLAGSYMSSKSSKKGAKAAAKGAEFRPGSVFGPAGNAVFVKDPRTGQFNLNLSPNQSEHDLRTGLQGRALEGIEGGPYAGLSSYLRDQTAPTIFDLYGDYQDTDTYLGDFGLGTAADLTELGDAATGVGLQGVFSGLSGPSVLGASNSALSLGGSFLNGAGPSSFNQLAAERLSALRGLAKPTEDRLVNSRINSLFSQGRLGTTGGSQLLGDLSEALGREDMARITSSQDFAQNQLNTERQFVNSERGLGAQLLGMGMQGITAEQANALQRGGFGAELLRLAGQSRGGAMSAIEASDASRLSRGQNRLATAQGLFNFGDALDASSLDRALASLGGAQTIDQTLLDQARIGASVGASQASAGANAGALRMQGSGSILGGALQGLGAGITNSNNNGGKTFAEAWSGLFNKGGDESWRYNIG
jgi:hypothetical protein